MSILNFLPSRRKIFMIERCASLGLTKLWGPGPCVLGSLPAPALVPSEAPPNRPPSNSAAPQYTPNPLACATTSSSGGKSSVIQKTDGGTVRVKWYELWPTPMKVSLPNHSTEKALKLVWRSLLIRVTICAFRRVGRPPGSCLTLFPNNWTKKVLAMPGAMYDVQCSGLQLRSMSCL